MDLDYPRGYRHPTRGELLPEDPYRSHRHQTPHGYGHRDRKDTHHRREEYREDKHRSHHDRNIAGGAIAGAGLAELVHQHHKRKGDHASHGVGHFVRTVGAGALGAVAANEISKAHEAHRAKESHSHSHSHSHGGHDHGHGDGYGYYKR